MAVNDTSARLDGSSSSSLLVVGLAVRTFNGGGFPRCRFANLVLWNRFMQTLDYETRTISLNRAQTVQDAQGNFEIIVAHRDPGRPNWLDTEGRPYGLMFWRFQLPEEDIQPLETEVITL